MKNKKKLIVIIALIAILLFIGLYFIYNYSEPNILNSKDKKWIAANNEKVIDIAVVNNIPIYANDGKGIVFEYLDYVKEQSKLDFNIIPYLKDSAPTGNYRIEILDGDVNLKSNQLLIFNDPYIVLSKNEIKIDSVDDLSGMALGILKDDVSNINYYLKSVNNLKSHSYSTIDSMFDALNNNGVNAIIIPHIIYLDYSIGNKYFINYFFTEISKNVVFTLDNDNKNLNSIFTKTYNKWFNEKYVTDYNKLLLDYYISENNINDKTKADLLSKTYVYGYVSNEPYEVLSGGNMNGIAIEYINRIVRLTDIDISYVKYNSLKELKTAIEKGEVDIYFDYFNYQDDKYLKTKSTFIEKYVVLGRIKDEHYINTLESLKAKDVNMLSNNALLSYITDNTMANVVTFDKISDLNKDDNIIILDNEVYIYYHDDYFKDYEVLYSDIMSNDYRFLVKSDNDTFYNLFNYIINTNSYYKYRNLAYSNLDVNLLQKLSFEELYLIILGIILVPVIIGIIIFITLKNHKKLKLVKKEDRKKYMDMLTSLKNRNYLNLNIDKWNDSKIYPQTIIIIDLNNVKYVNDNYGREKGDLLIVRAASTLVNMQLEKSEIIRSDGNEFLIYTVGYNENQIEIYADKLSKTLKDLPYGFGAAIGYSMINDDIKTIDDAINEAVIAMQSDKESYR